MLTLAVVHGACGAVPTSDSTGDSETAVEADGLDGRAEDRTNQRGDDVESGAAEPPPAPAEPVRAEVEALRQRLDAARTPAQIWALTSPERGLDADFAHSIGHFARTACTVDELHDIDSELGSYGEDFGVDSLTMGQLFELPQLSCDRSLSRCVSCAASLSDCDGQTLFELQPGPDGEPRLYGIVTSFTSAFGYHDEPPDHVDELAAFEVGQATEVGVKCALRAQLARGGIRSVRVEHYDDADGPLVRATVLRGRRATRFAERLALELGPGAYCTDENCVAYGDDGIYAVFYRRNEEGRFTLPVVTVSQTAGCPGCFAYPRGHRHAADPD